MRKAVIRVLLAYSLASAAALCRAEIIDRIVVTVDNHVITQSDVLAAIRSAAFLNGDKPDLSAANRRTAATRLVDQALFAHEMELTHYLQPAPEEMEEPLKVAKARFASDAAYKSALAAFGIDEAALKNALKNQLALLRFIDLRFRPEVQVQDTDVEQYYKTVFLPEARRREITPEPSFEQVRAQCEQALTEKAIDERLERWLKAARSRARIVYQEDAFE